jgi:hypothetical protein
MSKVIEKGYDINIEYEHTISSREYENYKPKLSATVPIEDVNGTLSIMRKILQFEETKIRNDSCKPKE